MAATKNHPYHILPLSPWPIVASLAAMLAVIGGILWMHAITALPFWIGLGLLLLASAGWGKDIIAEAHSQKDHTPKVQHGLRMGMALFIASEVAFFGGFFWAFFNFSLFPTDAIGGSWPPGDIKVIPPFQLPYLNTLVLLLSGTTITWAHQALLLDDRQGLVRGLGLTVLLGVLFLGIQALEYAHAPFPFRDSLYGSTFFMMTGFHGFHVLMGGVLLFICLFRALSNHFTPRHHVGFEAAAWYWHFVDVVWLFLFVWVYWWGS